MSEKMDQAETTFTLKRVGLIMDCEFKTTFSVKSQVKSTY